MVLTGTEVKALRIGKANIGDSYVRIKRNEAFVYKMHIGPYPYAAFGNHEPERIRKLLLHKREIKRLIGKIQEKGYTFKDHVVKVEIALAKGKKLHDKRQAIKKRDEKRDLDRTMKRYKR